MKRCFFVMLVILLTITTLGGCQPTPEKEVIIQPNNAIENNAEAPLSSPGTVEAYVAPAQWQEQYEPYDFIVCNIDMDITLPDMQRYPVFVVQPRELDISAFSAFREHFAADATGVRLDEPTKEELMQELENVKKGHIQHDQQGNFYWEPYEGQEEDIARLNEAIAAAPQETFLPLAQMDFTWPNGYRFQLADGSKCRITGNASRISFVAHGGLVQSESWITRDGGYPGEPAGTKLENIKISQEAAIVQAEEALSALQIHNLGLADIEKARILIDYSYETDSEGWLLTYVRNDGGYDPIAFRNYGSSMLQFDENLFSAPFYSETLTIYIDETGIRQLLWNNPLEVAEERTDNAALLPFGDIQARILQAMKIGLAWMKENPQLAETGFSFTFHSMRLSNCIVPMADSPGQALLVPVWALEYGEDSFTAMGNSPSILCINALDGSFVNPYYALVAE